MESYGLFAVGGSSAAFIMSMCDAFHERHTDDRIVFVGIHPVCDKARQKVRKLRHMGFRAETVEMQGSASADILALATLFQMFNGITVEAPQLIVLALDETFIDDQQKAEQCFKVMSIFKESNPNTSMLAIYFTREPRNTHALDKLKAHVSGRVADKRATPFEHALVIRINSSLGAKFGDSYTQILARQLAILLTPSDSLVPPLTLSQQVEQIRTPLAGLALDVCDVPHNWAAADALQRELPRRAIDSISRTLVESTINLLNNTPRPQTSFDRIGPEAREHGNEMLAINIFTPPVHHQSHVKLDQSVQSALSGYGVDAQSAVVEIPQRATPGHGMQELAWISCSVVGLINEEERLKHVPLVNQLPGLRSHEKACQILILFGVEDSRTP